MSGLLILGAGSDIARATARRFARNGYDLYLAARRPGELKEDIKDIEVRYGVKVHALKFDVLDYPSHEKFYASLPEPPSVVLCAIGTLGAQDPWTEDFASQKLTIETNYLGCVSILNIAAKDMEQRSSGVIAAISSVAGDRGRQSNYIYGSSKAALSEYLSGLRNRLSSKGVHVLTVKPGFVRTRMTEGLSLPEMLMAEPDEVAEDIYRGVISRRNVVYSKWFWQFIMLAIRHIPEPLFKKLSL